jgi:hypothetical protein
MSFEVPILFLGYNRPDLTLRTFTRILEITPTKLYVALDGPKVQRKNDIQKCQEVKEIITSNIKSGCVVHYKFNTVNQGCGLAVKSAIDWFFTSEEFGIIIEDDCLPTLSFFPFCEELLYKFQFGVCIRDHLFIFRRDGLSLLHFVTIIADSCCPEPHFGRPW